MGMKQPQPPYKWDMRWLAGWAALLGTCLTYELVGYRRELKDKDYRCPPLSNVLVGLVPMPALQAATWITALLLSVHWLMVKADPANWTLRLGNLTIWRSGK